MNHDNLLLRKHYLRPIYVSVFLSVFAELMLFLYFGVALNSEGNLLNKFIWSVVFCGLGMGSVLGITIIIFVLDYLRGWFAVVMTTCIAIILFGVGFYFDCD